MASCINYKLEILKDVENVIPEYLIFVFSHLKLITILILK